MMYTLLPQRKNSRRSEREKEQKRGGRGPLFYCALQKISDSRVPNPLLPGPFHPVQDASKCVRMHAPILIAVRKSLHLLFVEPRRGSIKRTLKIKPINHKSEDGPIHPRAQERGGEIHKGQCSKRRDRATSMVHP